MTRLDAPPIRLSGDLDIATTARVLVGFGMHPREIIAVDMPDATFIHAAALGVIMHLRNDVIALGGTLQLTAVLTPSLGSSPCLD